MNVSAYSIAPMLEDAHCWTCALPGLYTSHRTTPLRCLVVVVPACPRLTRKARRWRARRRRKRRRRRGKE